MNGDLIQGGGLTIRLRISIVGAKRGCPPFLALPTPGILSEPHAMASKGTNRGSHPRPPTVLGKGLGVPEPSGSSQG